MASAVAPPRKGVILVALTTDYAPYTSAHVEECPDIGPVCATATPPRAYNHNLRTQAYGVTLDAQVGIASSLAISVSVPYRFLTTRIHYTDLAGADYTPDPPDVHHRDETIGGFADPTIAALFGRAIGRVGFLVRLGVMAPLGRTLPEDPFVAGREGRIHEHAQFGAGTTRPIVGSALGYDFGPVGIDAFFQATLSLADNAIGYRTGQRLTGGLRVSSAFGLTGVRFGLGVEASHESTETWHDVVEEEGNLGRTDVFGVATARWALPLGFGVFGALKVPLYVNAVGAQLSSPVVAQLGVAAAFSP